MILLAKRRRERTKSLQGRNLLGLYSNYCISEIGPAGGNCTWPPVGTRRSTRKTMRRSGGTFSSFAPRTVARSLLHPFCIFACFKRLNVQFRS